MANYQTPLFPGCYYHLFNHAVGNERLFKWVDNYEFFLQKVHKYLLPIADLYSYNLLPNHFHLFFKIKTEDELNSTFKLIYPKKREILTYERMPSFALQQISNLQNSYAKAYNKAFVRRGRLFLESVKRREIISEASFTNIIHYLHSNAVHHGLCRKITEWPYSSYHELIHLAPTTLKRQQVLDWFGGREQFIRFHEQKIELKLKE
jgi:putative transposase